MFPDTVHRVSNNTCSLVNQQIERATINRLAHIAKRGAPAIEARLDELDREWDIERTLETNASTLSLIGLGLGFMLGKRWFILPSVVASFLLQHAVQGWCPPLPVLRRLGFRTQSEIERERYALKLMRGDFEQTQTQRRDRSSAENAYAAASI